MNQVVTVHFVSQQRDKRVSSTYDVVKILAVLTSDLKLVIKDIRYVWVSASESTQTYCKARTESDRIRHTHTHTHRVIKSHHLA